MLSWVLGDVVVSGPCLLMRQLLSPQIQFELGWGNSDGDQQRRLITFKLKPGDEAGQRWGSFLVGDEFAWEQRRAGEGGCGWVRAGNQETVREERLSSTLLGAVPGGCEFNRKDRLTGYYFKCAEVYRKEEKLN